MKRAIKLGRPLGKLKPRAIRKLRRELAGLLTRRHGLWHRFALPRKTEDRIARLRARIAGLQRNNQFELILKLSRQVDKIQRRRPSIPQATVGREVQAIDRRTNEIVALLGSRS